MKKPFYYITAITAFILFFSASFTYAALYKWVDEKGQAHITDYPGPDQEIREEKTKAPEKKYRDTLKDVKENVQDFFRPKQEQTKEKTGTPAVAPPLQKAPSQEQPQTAPTAQPDPQKAVPSFPKVLKLSPTKARQSEAPTSAVWIIVFVVVMAALYVYICLCLFLIAKKLNVPSPFYAWIPLIQAWTFVVAAKGADKHPCLWILAMVIPIIGPFVGVYLWICITENLGRNKWLGLLSLLPVVNLGLMGWLAFSKEET